jgi:branched-chain amino acid transport system ATP-binding protein
VISGVLAPTLGSIEMLGVDVTKTAVHRRIALGLARTFQLTNLFNRLTVEQNIILALQGLKAMKLSMLRPLGSYRELETSAMKLMEEWGFRDKRDVPVHELSYGEQRALEIVLAVSQQPRLMLLDEPTAGLSPSETAAACAMIKSLPREISIVLIEHDLDVVFDLCESITVLHFGEVLTTGSPEVVRANPDVQEIYFGGVIGEPGS